MGDRGSPRTKERLSVNQQRLSASNCLRLGEFEEIRILMGKSHRSMRYKYGNVQPRRI